MCTPVVRPPTLSVSFSVFCSLFYISLLCSTLESLCFKNVLYKSSGLDNSKALLGSWVNLATALLVSPVCLQSYEEERRIRTDLELRCQRLTLELADTKQHIQEGDYRRDNYPSIKRFVCV